MHWVFRFVPDDACVVGIEDTDDEITTLTSRHYEDLMQQEKFVLTMQPEMIKEDGLDDLEDKADEDASLSEDEDPQEPSSPARKDSKLDS